MISCHILIICSVAVLFCYVLISKSNHDTVASKMCLTQSEIHIFLTQLIVTDVFMSLQKFFGRVLFLHHADEHSMSV